MITDAPERFAGENMMRDILAKDPAVVTEAERDILRARKTYLTREEIEKFGLDDVKAEPVAPVAEPVKPAEPATPAPARTRKTK